MKRLVNLKYKEGRSITKYTSEFQGLVDQLTTMKIILDNELQALLLFSSLLNSWETLVMSVNNSASNEESIRKSVEAVPSKSDELVSKKQERRGKS